MLFNSISFVFVFLPIVLLLYTLSISYNRVLSKLILISASLFFYAWWNPIYLILLILSIIFNYYLAHKILQIRKFGRSTKSLLFIGIASNLLALGYFKYADFFIQNFNTIFQQNFVFDEIILPLAISFFTFQQITYLADAHNGKIDRHDKIDYCLFVTFFPQLIAGPIVHHSEMMPQFNNPSHFRFHYKNIYYGLLIFSIGMLKKTVLADSAAEYANPLFEGITYNIIYSFWETWMCVAAFGFQIYFDFSGYSDMAIGLACLFGIRLPLNFNSPYKAPNIIEFWRRWHMTLSRFLRDYLYVPLGGNRKGVFRRYLNLMATMLLGGLWHGAAWTFVAWGALHGLYLCINHLWRNIKTRFSLPKLTSNLSLLLGRILTLLAVFFAWTLFRAETWSSAATACSTMLGFHGIDLPRSISSIPFPEILIQSDWIRFNGMFISQQFNYFSLPFLVVLLFLTWFAPNTQSLLSYNPVITNAESTQNASKISHWKVFGCGFLFFWAMKPLFENTSSEFLYFNF